MRSPTPWALSPTRLLLVALPLLALALLVPSAAFAASPCSETSAEITYCPEVPTIEGGGSPKKLETQPTTRRRSKPKTEEEPVETTEPETEPSPSEGHRSKVAPPAKGGNHPGGGNHAAPKQSGDHIGPAKSVAPKSGQQNAKGVPASASSGGSSPVLPILVAIVVLAAISIGVVVYRERKGGDGQTGYTGAQG